MSRPMDTIHLASCPLSEKNAHALNHSVYSGGKVRQILCDDYRVILALRYRSICMFLPENAQIIALNLHETTIGTSLSEATYDYDPHTHLGSIVLSDSYDVCVNILLRFE